MIRQVIFYVCLILLLVACTPGISPAALNQDEPPPTELEPTAIPATATIAPTERPRPSPTPVPPTATEIPPTDTPTPEPTVDLQAAIQSARIILYEDMWFDRYIQPALDQGGYKYTDVGDKAGKFKEELLSGSKWDLVIAAAEGRGGVQGEFFDYIYQQLDNGASVILEMWILDYVAGGRIQPMLDECGIEVQKDWINPSNRGVFWTDPNHPLANDPNPLSLDRFTNYWEGDVGDLVQKSPGSEAIIIGSANDANLNQDGLITVCYDGRLLLQTFSTHDHSKETMMQLWQNYVSYMLSNRFAK
jgi:hypothetical protein